MLKNVKLKCFKIDNEIPYKLRVKTTKCTKFRKCHKSGFQESVKTFKVNL